MRNTVNSYLAMLFITIAGAGAALLIVHVATDNMLASTALGNEANYLTLQNSILHDR